MLKSLIVLPNGREISSGASGVAITEVSLTQYVNDTEELSLGSVCADVLEVEMIDKEQALQLQRGDEIWFYKLDDREKRHQVGVFTLEKPVRPTANTIRLTAYDRVARLDKDLTSWLEGLDGWPYTLSTFAQMVCNACGLELADSSLLNGDYLVQAFNASGITGRKLMQWVGEIAGRFCRATPAGKLEFAWYTPADVMLTPGGERYYFQNGLTYQDYQVAPVEKVQIQLTRDDVGVVWPDVAGEKNTYRITGNYLLTTMETATLQPVAQNLYELLKTVTYTPGSLVIPACVDIQAGHTVQIRDLHDQQITLYVMGLTQKGQTQTLYCTGSHHRDSTEVMNNEDYRTRNSRSLELVKQAEGLELRALQTQVEMGEMSEHIANLQVKAEEVSLRVNRIDSSTDQVFQSVNNSLQSLQKEVSAKMTADAVQLQIQSAMDDGVSKVVTNTGFTFDDTGMTVEKSGREMKTQITENGMRVYQNNAEVLTADQNGVDARNLHATTYLMVGGRSRFENYGSDRTGCFWIGG